MGHSLVSFSYPAKVFKIVIIEKNENDLKEVGIGPSKKQASIT